MGRPLNDPSGPGVLLTARVPRWLKNEVQDQATRHGVPFGRMVQRLLEAANYSVNIGERGVERPVDGELDFEIADEVDVAAAQFKAEVIVPGLVVAVENHEFGVFVDVVEADSPAGEGFKFQVADRSVAARLLEGECYIVLMSGPGGGE